MKKITSRILALAAGTIALSSILCSCGGKSLKLIHSTGPSNDNMYAGVMFSEKQGYTFGEKGVVLRTDDGVHRIRWNIFHSLKTVSEIDGVEFRFSYIFKFFYSHFKLNAIYL